MLFLFTKLNNWWCSSVCDGQTPPPPGGGGMSHWGLYIIRSVNHSLESTLNEDEATVPKALWTLHRACAPGIPPRFPTLSADRPRAYIYSFRTFNASIWPFWGSAVKTSFFVCEYSWSINLHMRRSEADDFAKKVTKSRINVRTRVRIRVRVRVCLIKIIFR